MPRARPYCWVRDQSNGPVIIEREPHFLNPFKSRNQNVRVVRQEIHRGRQRADRPEFFDVREREPRRSEESVSMSRTPRRDEFVPLPPRIPIHHQGPDPIVEVLPPNPRRTPELHQGPRRNSFDFPINHPPVRAYEPERVIERERDLRRNADRLARQETRKRREAEEEAERVRQAAARERDHRRRAQKITQKMERMVINEREKLGEAEEEIQRLAAEAADANARARQAEEALSLERRLADRERERERERAARERQRQAEIEDADAWNHRRRSVHVFQQDLDRGAEVLRQAQEAERRRRESDAPYRVERNRQRDVPRRLRNLTIFDDDDDRWRYRSI